MTRFYIIETGETIEGTITGTDEMFEGNDFYQILTTKDGTTYKAFYLAEDQEDALDEYGNLILDEFDANRISYIKVVEQGGRS